MASEYIAAPDGILRTVVAFANTAGGVLLIGVEDRTRRVRGVSAPLDAEERLASLLSDSILPRLLPEVELLAWRRTQVLAVQVFPSGTRPHHLSREGIDRGTYVRVGSTNRRADRELRAELGRYARGESYDEQALPELGSEAVDFRAASESFREVRTLRRTDLPVLGLLTRHQGRLVPTVGGMLLFGRHRERRHPDAWIQVGRFRGVDRARLDDHAELRLPLPAAVAAAIAFVQKHSRRGADIGTLRRREVWNLPPVAVREAVINAVAHADYAQTGAPIRLAIFDDRLEIENPGLLPFGLTVEDLAHGVSKLRNRVIGRVFSELGLMEQWGSGVQRMTAACQEAGLPAPVFEELATRFRVTLSTRRTGKQVMAQPDRQVLELLAGPQGSSTREIAAALGVSTRAARTRLARMVERGLLREIGTSPQDPKRRYYRVD